MKTDAIVRRDWNELVEARGGRRFVHEWAPLDVDISEGLAAAGVEVRQYEVDLEAFERFADRCGYREPDFWGSFGKVGHAQRMETCLEHFVSVDLMQPRKGEVLVDVASRRSPFATVVKDHYGVRAFRHDGMLFPPGVDGDTIGGDPTSLPLGDSFANLASLHCSFEHMEGDRDSFFLREANRILKPGGRLCILPLYLSHQYSIQSDPLTWSSWPVRFDAEAVVHLAKGWGESFGRLYDVERFQSRFVAHLGDLELVVYNVENAKAVDPGCHLSMVALLTKARKRAGRGRKAGAYGVNGTVMRSPEVTLFSEAAELRHQVYEARRQATVNKNRVRDAEGHLESYRRELAASESRSMEARRAFEAEIAKLTRVVVAQQAGIEERDSWITMLKDDLAKVHAAHHEATQKYECEVVRLAEVASELRFDNRDLEVRLEDSMRQSDLRSRQHARATDRCAAEIARLQTNVRLQEQQLAENVEEADRQSELIAETEAQCEDLLAELYDQHKVLRDRGFKISDLEESLEAAHRHHDAACECYEAEIKKILAAANTMERQKRDRDDRLAAYNEELDRAYAGHSNACVSYEKEHGKLTAALAAAQSSLQERDDYIAELIERINMQGLIGRLRPGRGPRRWATRPPAV